MNTNKKYIIDYISTNAGKIPRVSTSLTAGDKLGSLKARLGISRMKYIVDPGLYAVGNPDKHSNVYVTANYKMSFDSLRRALNGIDAWILVLDTKGINVWCAAGKGTFGSLELAGRIEVTKLSQVVDHKKLILPQLGAVGVAAQTIKLFTGFSVIFGPVRDCDIPAFIQNEMKAAPQMRRITFGFFDRLVLVPMEAVIGFKYVLGTVAVFFLLSGLSRNGYSFKAGLQAGVLPAVCIVLAYFAGCVLGPLFLPVLPGRSFSVKGFYAGLSAYILLYAAYLKNLEINSIIVGLLIMPALSSFLTMNFTGASTYTSLSGVQKEMRIALPFQIAGAAAGVLLWSAGRFI